MGAGGTINIKVNVKNSGSKDGAEVVQLYIRDMVGTITRPVKELKAFRKIFLKAGETQEVSFALSENDLKFYNDKLEFVAEPGEFKVFVGNSSANVKETGFKLVK